MWLFKAVFRSPIPYSGQVPNAATNFDIFVVCLDAIRA